MIQFVGIFCFFIWLFIGWDLLDWKSRNTRTKQRLILIGLWFLIALTLFRRGLHDILSPFLHKEAACSLFLISYTALAYIGLYPLRSYPWITALLAVAWSFMFVPVFHVAQDYVYMTDKGFALVPPYHQISCSMKLQKKSEKVVLHLDRDWERIRIEWPPVSSSQDDHGSVWGDYQKTKSGTFLEEPEYKEHFSDINPLIVFSTNHGGKIVEYTLRTRTKKFESKVIASPKQPPVPDWELADCGPPPPIWIR